MIIINDKSRIMSVTSFIASLNSSAKFLLHYKYQLVIFTLCLILGVIGLNSYNNIYEKLQQTLSQNDKLQLQLELESQQQIPIIQLKDDTESQLALLASHVAKLQAKLARVEALGTQLAQKSNLSDMFDFTNEVGIGGFNDDNDIGNKVTLEQLLDDMNKLASGINNSKNQLSLLETVTTNLNIDKERQISGFPVEKGYISSNFGFRSDPFSGRRVKHKGIDFAGAEGSSIIATGAGVVTWAGKRSGYGKFIEIEHSSGFSTRYAHNKKILVSVGDIVTKGEQIAVMGSTGRSTGSHVHYEVVRNGQRIDPRQYVYRKAS